MKISSTVLLLIQYRFHIVFEPNRLRIACLRACLCAGRQARRQTGRQASRMAGRSECGQACRPVCMSARVCIHENPHAVWLASIHADITTLLCPLIPSFPFFFWAAWASENDALKSEITALIQIRLLTDFLCSQKHSKVSFELPEGFSVTAEKWQQQGMFRVTRNLSGYSRKPCRRAAPPRSGNLYILKKRI